MDEQLFQRLAKERARLGLTQEQMAKAGGVAKRTYCNYEIGEREPSSSFISAVKDIGVDVGYLLFGIQQFDSLGTSPSEARLLNLYRQLTDDNKHALEAVAITLAKPHLAEAMQKVVSQKPGRIHQQINAPVKGGVAGRDLNHQGRKKKNDAGDQQ